MKIGRYVQRCSLVWGDGSGEMKQSSSTFTHSLIALLPQPFPKQYRQPSETSSAAGPTPNINLEQTFATTPAILRD